MEEQRRKKFEEDQDGKAHSSTSNVLARVQSREESHSECYGLRDLF